MTIFEHTSVFHTVSSHGTKGQGPSLAPLTSLGLKRLHSWMSTQNNRAIQYWGLARRYCLAERDIIKLFTSLNIELSDLLKMHLVKLLKQQMLHFKQQQNI